MAVTVISDLRTSPVLNLDSGTWVLTDTGMIAASYGFQLFPINGPDNVLVYGDVIAENTGIVIGSDSYVHSRANSIHIYSTGTIFAGTYGVEVYFGTISLINDGSIDAAAGILVSNSGGSIVVNGSINARDSHGILATGNVADSITVNGAITATGVGIQNLTGYGTTINNGGISAGLDALSAAGGNSQIENNGSLSGRSGISATGSDNAVTNRGTISARAQGVANVGNDAQIVNSGQIQILGIDSPNAADQAIGIYLEGNEGAIVNSGEIEVHSVSSLPSVGIRVAGTGYTSITNAGLISAATALSATGGLETITNTSTGVLVGRVELGVYGDRLNNIGTIVGAVFGEGGDDTLVSSGTIVGSIRGGDGNDVIDLRGGTISGEATGDEGNDTIYGTNGDNLILGGAGNDYIDGAGGIDTASYAAAAGAVRIRLAVTSAQNTLGDGRDTLRNIENVVGSEFNDVLFGNVLANELRGGLGDDVLDGFGGADQLFGGGGNDRFYVDDADDGVYEGMTEGADDTVYASVDYELIAGQGIENLIANAGAAGLALTGNELANNIYGAVSGGSDRLSGAEGNDRLYGREGNDWINGGAGIDNLFGGSGNDVFVLQKTSADFDYVRDFVVADDQIEISAALFGSGLVAGNALSGLQFITNATGSASNGGDATTRFIYRTTDGVLYLDTNGSGSGGATAIGRILDVAGNPVALTAADFNIVA